MPYWVWLIVIGLVAGWATGKIMKGSGYGFFVDTLLGVAGAFVGYTAGPSISRSWGIDGRRSARQRKQASQDGGVRSARAEAVGTAGPGPTAQAPRAAAPGSVPAPRAAAKTSFPPVQTLD